MNIYTHRTEVWTQVDEGEIRQRLEELRDVAARVKVDTDHAVSRARTLGLSWQQIAEQLGTSKQAAQQRFGWIDRV